MNKNIAWWMKPLQRNEDVESLGGFSRGQRIEAHEVYKTQWRPAYIVSFTLPGRNKNPGCYIQWLDVLPGDMSKSQGGWQPLSALRLPVEAEVVS